MHPAVAEPLRVTVSPVITPARLGVPVMTAVFVRSYTLFEAASPEIVSGAFVMLAVKAVVTPVIS